MSAPDTSQQRIDYRRPRPPGFLYTGLTMVLIIVVGALTITASQTPPPAIAEFAPEAVEQIKEAPLEQTSQVGEAEGLATGSTTTTTTTTPPPGAQADVTTTTRPTIERARVRRCVGDPPRQTEDPQSPPCVPFWEGDNGGATYKGVTGNEIRVLAQQLNPRQQEAFEIYFNQRYELYDRTLNLLTDTELRNDGTCETMTANAAHVDDEVGVFASLASNGSPTPCFYDELARREILVVLGQTQYAEDEMAAFHPYHWQYPASNDRIMQAVGEMACARLAGGPAEHSTHPATQTTTRKFGAILQYPRQESTVSIDPLRQELAKCGERVELYDYGDRVSPATDRSAILKMSTNKVTSVVCLCAAFLAQGLAPAATSQGYFPEWIVSTYGGFDVTLVVKAFFPDSRQRQALFGATLLPRQRNLEEDPAWWAVREADPTFPQDQTNNLAQFYHELLLLVSGIQMAGPNLTPETFEAALHRTEFPNPPHPGNFGRVGFTTGDHSMTEDAAEYFWNEAQRSPRSTTTSGSGDPGALCYVEQGARRQLGQWPRGGDVFFNPRPPAPCFSGG